LAAAADTGVAGEVIGDQTRLCPPDVMSRDAEVTLTKTKAVNPPQVTWLRTRPQQWRVEYLEGFNRRNAMNIFYIIGVVVVVIVVAGFLGLHL
jgi:hypothetical protein